MTTIRYLVIISSVFALASCSSGQSVKTTEAPNGPPHGVDVCKDRPAWVCQPAAETEGENKMFVGESPQLYSTDGEARKAARRDAETQAAQWVETNALAQARRGCRAYNLNHVTSDCTVGEDEYSAQVSQASIHGLKDQKYHVEWMRASTGPGYVAWVLTALPAASVQNAAFAAAQAQAQEAQARARAAATAKAKQQAKNAADFWSQFGGSMGGGIGGK